MKKHFVSNFLFLLLCTFQTYAHAPVVNYEKIDAWCQGINLANAELQPLQEYLMNGKTLMQACSQDPDFINSDQGKKLLAIMDDCIQAFMKNDALKNAFQYFVILTKEELAENPSNSVKKGYRLLTMIYEGCLHCVNDKIQPAQ